MRRCVGALGGCALLAFSLLTLAGCNQGATGYVELKTVPASVFNGITLPPRVVEAIGERFVEAMAYPELDIPMYRPLGTTSGPTIAICSNTFGRRHRLPRRSPTA